MRYWSASAADKKRVQTEIMSVAVEQLGD